MNLLKEKTALIVSRLYGQEILPEQVQVNIPPKDFPFDFTIVAFAFSKLAKKSPDQTANEIGAQLINEIPELDRFEVVKGFLNLRLKDNYWINIFGTEINSSTFGVLPPTGKKIMVEYCGPNTNKPLHLGHLRNIFIGHSTAAILKAAGNEVIKVNIYNDRGVHICKSMLAYQKYGNHETPESSGEKGDHLVGEYYVRFEQELRKQVSELVAQGLTEEAAKKQAPLNKEISEMLLKWEQGDEEVRNLWQTLNQWVYQGFEETYRKIGNDFDKAYMESATYMLGKTIVAEGLEKNIFFKKTDGSVWVDLTADGLDQKVLLRADGTSVYITQDLGTADLRYKDYAPDVMIYTVANEQDYHFKVLKLVCQKLGRPYANGIHHLSYGLVDLPTGRMKTREGTVVDADDLLDEMDVTAAQKTKEVGKIENFTEEEQQTLFHQLGLGALKFFILKVDPKKRIIFNPEESIDFHGFTGPFIQYTHARICSVLRKASERNISVEGNADITSLDPVERQLIMLLNEYPAILSESAAKYEPSTLANYLYQLAKEYNHFYATLQMLNEEDEAQRKFRLQLSAAIASTIKKGMKLLGIDVPEQM
ncbi:MAG TPA: arginine--tRNA ligase [Chitinophagales bacterium]|nr:arginine--tRNA ligase [Chitinophagales bacterium]